jgi:hypothetical protein
MYFEDKCSAYWVSFGVNWMVLEGYQGTLVGYLGILKGYLRFLE